MQSDTSDEDSSNSSKAAKAAFEEGRKLFEAEKYQEAAQHFRKAQHLSPSWKIHYNIGQCEAAAKRYGVALEAFELYLSEGGDGVELARENEVLAEINTLKQKVGKIKVIAPDDAVIIVDGTIRGTAPLSASIRVSAGQVHEIKIELSGEILLQKELKVWTGDTFEVVASTETETKTGNESNSKPAASPPPGITRSKLLPFGLIIGGTGLATLIAGGVLGGITTARASELKDNCPNNICTNPSDQQRLEDARTLGTVSTVLFVAGGVLTATGLTLAIVGKKKSSSEQLTMKLSPVASPVFNGVVLKGQF